MSNPSELTPEAQEIMNSETMRLAVQIWTDHGQDKDPKHILGTCAMVMREALDAGEIQAPPLVMGYLYLMIAAAVDNALDGKLAHCITQTTARLQ